MTLGLYLIIFYEAFDFTIRIFLGFMFFLGGVSIGGGLAFFNTHYKSTYQLIDQFTKE